MPSNYAEIRQANIRRRGEEFDDIGRLIAEHLYSDRSHFIYELLQNAEDALAQRFEIAPDTPFDCTVRFNLFPDRLEFRHFGQPFNRCNVQAISDILRGTKATSSDQIGKFGIGFKSVYAFTSSPEVHSGDEHFVIRRYIRPEAKEPHPLVSIAPTETVFIFPFDHHDLCPDQARDLISKGLRALNPQALLFLSRIAEISWTVYPARETGLYLKDASRPAEFQRARRVALIGQANGHDEDQQWLVFERPVTIAATRKPALNHQRDAVEIAFRLESRRNHSPARITRIDPSPLVAYFQTEKHTNLGFLIHGPYHTTPARDNILQDNAYNARLIEDTAELTVDALRQLKAMGLLSVSVLETLPIKAATFAQGTMFHPIFSRVKRALISEALLPTDDETKFVAARSAVLARGADLMKLLTRPHLQALFSTDDPVHWLSPEITDDRTPELREYLIHELSVEEVTPDVFARHITKSFLEDQSDAWMVAFYGYLAEQRSLWRSSPRHSYPNPGILRSRPILRLQDGSHVKPFSGVTPNAYLPLESTTATLLPLVKPELCKDERARRFLKELGVPDLDLVAEVIDCILPKYDRDSNVPADESERDLRTIGRAYATDSSENKERLRARLKETPFVPATLFDCQEVVYRQPGHIYFFSDGLAKYFDGNASFVSVAKDHPQSRMFADLGVAETVRVKRRFPQSRGYVTIVTAHGHHRRGLNGFDPDIQIDGLDFALSNPTFERSRFVWDHIAIRHSDCIRGTVEMATRQAYDNAKQQEHLSEFGRLLINAVWLPDVHGEMHAPSNLALDDLHAGFRRDEKLADVLGMKKDAVAELCEEAGVSRSAIDLAQRIELASPEMRRHIERRLREQQGDRPQFPQGKLGDPGRRQSRLLRQIGDAPRRQSEKRGRSIRTSRGAIDPDTQLLELYTNGVGQMVCQVCKGEMPFKRRDGKYYFERVEALSGDYFTREHPAQYLALCPLCAAMYKEFVKRDEDAMKSTSRLLKESGELEVPLNLGRWETSIRFVETHRHDIRTILKEYRR